ncbi:MAG: hypothetical protein LIO56_07170 [Lachnospiraceae bacterium]|nr:hypothetical protein [Lachnospiraceae bacterium]
MRKLAVILCFALLLPCVLTACGRSSSDDSKVELTKRGRIFEYAVEDFSASNYDSKEMDDFVDDAIKAYKEDNKGRIKVKKNRVRKETAYLTLRYNNADTYAGFNQVECFDGTMEEALMAGYEFDMDFTRVSEPEAESEDASAVTSTSSTVTVSGDVVTGDEELKVFIIETDMDVTVPGDVQYYYTSYGVSNLTDKDTVGVYIDADIVGENNVVYVLYY